MAFVQKGREKILQYEKRENVMTRDDLYNSWDEKCTTWDYQQIKYHGR